MIFVGIVGAGDISSLHAEVYSALSNTKIVAVADPDIVKGRQFTSKYGGKAYSSLEEVLDSESIDIIDICSPDYLHIEHTTLALKEGKHVLCEKPIGLSLKKAAEVVKLAKRSRSKFMVGHVLRFFPEYEWIKETISEGLLGKPIAASAFRLNPYPFWRNWFTNTKQSGGATIDLLVHDADFYHWIFGQANHVMALGRKDKYGVWNHAQVLISFNANVAGSAEVSYTMPNGFPGTHFLRVLCENGCIEYSNRSNTPLLLFESGKDVICPDVSDKNPFEREISYFVECIEKDIDPSIVTPEEALYSLRIALACVKSMENRGKLTVV